MFKLVLPGRIAIACIALLAMFSAAQAQSPRPSPTVRPTPAADEQEPVRVFTEEVRLPVIAVDQYGHYDPTVEPEDILVLEDGIAQQIRSVQRVPPNVVLVLDTGGESSGLGGQSKRTSLTRDVAINVLRQLRLGTWVYVMQFNNSVEMISDWTNDTKATAISLKSKISSGKRARFAEAVVAAAQALSTRPEGSRHVVLITDGVDTGGKIDRSDAVKQLMEARATVHVVSYTEFVRQKKDNTPGGVRGGQLPPSSDPITSTDPTLPPGVTRSPSFGVGLRFDPEMRRRRKAYEASVKKSQQILTQMAAETGGQIFLPKSGDEMIAQARTVAKQIGAEYVLTYRPKRPLAQARAGEYRRVEVASRRVGLSVSSRRGYIVPAQ